MKESMNLGKNKILTDMKYRNEKKETPYKRNISINTIFSKKKIIIKIIFSLPSKHLII